MTDRAREILIVSALLLLAAIVFTLGINWGLPSRKTDAYLFGERTPWSGAEILKLAPQRNTAAADVDVNPALRGSVVNDTDAKRAEIVRRYRLFTYQPDEMITLMSLAGMHPSQLDFDPRLYQYGGLWIYPVGGLIRVLLHPKNDQAYYLDHPEAFGKFYIVARAYSAAWGVVGAWAVYALMRRLSRRAAIFATLLYITMPVVVNMAHEAKPHLAGTALMLLAALAAQRYIERGGWRRLALTSALCGAAAGVILSAIIAPIIAIVAIIIRSGRERHERVPLSPVLGGEGRGEGPSAASRVAFKDQDAPLPLSLSLEYREEGGEEHGAASQASSIEDAPHPNPLPRVHGRGDPKSTADRSEGLSAGIDLEGSRTNLPLPVPGERAGERVDPRDDVDADDAIGSRRTPLPLSLSPEYREEGSKELSQTTQPSSIEDFPHPNPLPVLAERAGERADPRDDVDAVDAIGSRRTPLPRSLSPEYREEGSKELSPTTQPSSIEDFPHRNPLPRIRGRVDQKSITRERAAEPLVEDGPYLPAWLRQPRVEGRGNKTWVAYVGGRAIASVFITALVYAISNPYVIKHLLFDRTVLTQNLGNSKAMYHVDLLAGPLRAIELIAAGGGWLTLIGGGVGLLVLLARCRRASARFEISDRDGSASSAADFSPLVFGDRKTSGLKFAAADKLESAQMARAFLAATLLPLIVVSLVVALQFAALAAGKPGEYGRFALVLDVTLMLVLVAALENGVKLIRVYVILCLLMCGNCASVSPYVHGFWSDSRNTTRRDELAATLAKLQSERGLTTVGIVDEPAPYLLPPIDLWKWKITLLPRDITLATAGTQVVVRPADGPIFDRAPRDGYRMISNSGYIDVFQPQIGWGMKLIEVWEPYAPSRGH